MNNTELTAALVVNGTVEDCVIADVEWARNTLGGDWHDTTGLNVGRGYALVDGEWRHPSPYPSWSWSDGDWNPSVPQPEPVEGHYWWWDEANGEWVLVAYADIV